MIGITFKKDRRKFWINFITNFIKVNPGRSILLPITFILFSLSLSIDNEMRFMKIDKYFESKETGLHYYILSNDVVESNKSLEVFEDKYGYYIIVDKIGEFKFISILLTSLFLIIVTITFFVEGLDINEVMKKTIIMDLDFKINKDDGNYYYVAYTKKILKSYSKKSLWEIEININNLTLSEFNKLETYLDQSEMRDKKLEEIGI